MILELGLGAEIGLGEIVGVVARLGQTFGVRVVRAEADVIGSEQTNQFGHIVLPERVDVDRALEDLDWVLGEVLRHPAIRQVELGQQVADPAGTVLDAHDAQVGEPAQGTVADHRRQCVFDLTMLQQQVLQSGRLERRVGAARLPRLVVY